MTKHHKFYRNNHINPSLYSISSYLIRVVIVRVEQQVTICSCSAESANTAVHGLNVGCLVRANHNHLHLAILLSSFLSKVRSPNSLYKLDALLGGELMES